MLKALVSCKQPERSISLLKGLPAAALAVVGSMARPLGDIDVMPLRAALAGHAHAVWVAVLAPASARHPLPVEVLHHHQQLSAGPEAWQPTVPALVRRMRPIQLMQALL